MGTRAITIPSWVTWSVLLLATGIYYAYASGIALFLMYAITCFNLFIVLFVLFLMSAIPVVKISHIANIPTYEKYLILLIDAGFAWVFLNYASQNHPLIIFQFGILAARILLIATLANLKRKINGDDI